MIAVKWSMSEHAKIRDRERPALMPTVSYSPRINYDIDMPDTHEAAVCHPELSSRAPLLLRRSMPVLCHPHL